MIQDNLGNFELYVGMHPGFERAFVFLQNFLLESPEDGRYPISGDNVYATVMSCDLKEDGKLESHKKAIDIQFILEGAEAMEYAPAKKLICTEDLSEEKDLLLYENHPNSSRLALFKGDFAVFFPGDAHKPGLILNGKHSRKIVVKVAL